MRKSVNFYFRVCRNDELLKHITLFRITQLGQEQSEISKQLMKYKFIAKDMLSPDLQITDSSFLLSTMSAWQGFQKT